MAYFLEVGLLLMVLPWSSFWERNYFVEAWPAIRPIIGNTFVRGGITGLGVLNLLAGFSELAPVFSARDSDAAQRRRARYDSRADSRAEP